MSKSELPSLTRSANTSDSTLTSFPARAFCKRTVVWGTVWFNKNSSEGYKTLIYVLRMDSMLSFFSSSLFFFLPNWNFLLSFGDERLFFFLLSCSPWLSLFLIGHRVIPSVSQKKTTAHQELRRNCFRVFFFIFSFVQWRKNCDENWFWGKSMTKF